VLSLLEYDDFINFDFPCKNTSDENIYPCLIDQQALTVVIGAKCKDGIVLIADRKLTMRNGEIEYKEKIFGDLEHVLIGYTGDAKMFDIFRKYTVGDVMIERHTTERYILDNLLSKVSNSIKTFNELVDYRPFKVLLVSHLEKPLKLYYIDTHGKWDNTRNYKSIGSGEDMADKFCRGLDFDKITMKEFTQHVYLAIMFMNQYCPALGVGVEPDGSPDITYMDYNKEKDEPASDEDKNEYNKYSEKKLAEFDLAFEKIVKE
jgi:20S proteasome alpha/beta subunit